MIGQLLIIFFCLAISAIWILSIGFGWFWIEATLDTEKGWGSAILFLGVIWIMWAYLFYRLGVVL